MGGNQERDESPSDTRPYLCLPYWTTPLTPGGRWDDGAQRPLDTTAVTSWLCDAVHAGPYTPGQPLEVSVDVRNSGGGNSAAMATVVVYWADPTVGFGKPTFLAATVVPVPPSRTTPAVTRTPTMRGTIPAGAPDHVCLLVAVSHPQDRAGTVCDPVGDRHWAQRNLTAAPVAPGAPALLPLAVANPLAEEAAFLLVVRRVDGERARRVAAETGTVPGEGALLVRLLDSDGAQVGRGGRSAHLDLGLGPREQRRFSLLVEVGSDLEPGVSLGLEAELFEQSGERVVGSLGMALVGPPG
ncbi:hypothetical protein [Modestobacter roseus]|uniref:hypothetical protein n=1 Tax=Modestobacter roseus TaxID=1181884 RepID=UPI001294C102|nr:hypothetical protein [Modestobacter roseus]MQA35908.1 hypothetical protein [Modestobacter roseus]